MPIAYGKLALLLNLSMTMAATGTSQNRVSTWVNGKWQQERDIDAKLFDAISKSDVSRVRILLKKGASPNAGGAESAIYAALDNCRTKAGAAIVRLLVGKGADINKRWDDWRPLFMAIQGAPKPIVELLVRKGAKLNEQMADFGTPLHYAAYNNRFDVLDTLIEHGAKVNAQVIIQPPASLKIPPGSDKADRDQMNSLNALLAADRKRSSGDTDREYESGWSHAGWTPLMFACVNDDLNCARFLIAHGANVNERSSIGRTALHEAAQRFAANAMKLLLDHGADVNARSKNGFAPLHSAVLGVFGGSPSCVRLLLQHGALVGARTKQGKSALQLVTQLRDHYDGLFKQSRKQKLDASQLFQEEEFERKFHQNINDLTATLKAAGAK